MPQAAEFSQTFVLWLLAGSFLVALLVPRGLAWRTNRTPSLRGALERAEGRTLVVIVHGGMVGRAKVAPLVALAKASFPRADFYVPEFSAGLFSNASLYHIADELESAIATFHRERRYGSVVLVGYSVGSLILRKAFVWGSGGDSIADRPSHGLPSGDWTQKVERIVLLAGTNRGWSLERRPKEMPRLKFLGAGLLLQVARLTGTGRLLRGVEHGAPFVADLRVQWIRLARPQAPNVSVTVPLVIQLLGSIDDVVTRSDNEDAAASKDFVFIPVPGTTHKTIREVGKERLDPVAERRTELVREALTGAPTQLRTTYPYRADEDPSITLVVLVVHGIRDMGHWSDAVRAAIESRSDATSVLVLPPRYGWYSMGRFLLWPSRMRNVRRFMNDYTDVVAKYPMAEISFIGHSNGTYILASALRDYVSLRITRAILAGSVIPSDFDWKRLAHGANSQVGAVRNIVGADDWVVALFPRFFELLKQVPLLGAFRGLDVGAAGFLGFLREEEGRYENVKFVTGGHSAFLGKSHPGRVKALANYVVAGSEDELSIFREQSEPDHLLSVVSPVCWAVWLTLVAVLFGVGLGVVAGSSALGWSGTVGGVLYAAIVLLLIFTV